MKAVNEQKGVEEERAMVLVDFRLNPEMGFTYLFACPDCKHEIEFRPVSMSLDYQFSCGGCGVNMSIDRKSLNQLEIKMNECLNVAIIEESIIILR